MSPGGAGVLSRRLMHEITTTIDIDAPPRTVWAALLDFGSHPQWNPFIRRIEGVPREGERLDVSIQPVGGRSMRFRPSVLRAVPDQELRWLGHLLVAGLFDGEHYFTIEPLDGGRRARFTQGERFTGLLVPLLRRQLDTGTKPGFEAMNAALKRRVEHGT